MPNSIPRIWAAVLAAVLVIAVGAGAFFTLNRDKKETPPAKTESFQIGVIDMEKAIASHPRYSAWLAAKQEETALLGDFNNNERLLAGLGKNKNPAMRESMDAVFEQEFNAKIKAKQDELNEKMFAKMQITREPLNSELQAYVQQLETEYQPQLFDLNLKLRVLQMEEPQAKDIVAKLEALKQEQSAKIEAKNRELSQKLDELMAPEMKEFDEEMSRYVSELNAELSTRVATGAKGLPSGSESDMPPELKKMEEKIIAKKQESAAIYEGIAKDVRYKTIDIAVKHGLEAVIGDFMVNFGALDVTDLVIAEFKK